MADTRSWDKEEVTWVVSVIVCQRVEIICTPSKSFDSGTVNQYGGVNAIQASTSEWLIIHNLEF
jgi:hypothetical protein